MHPERLELPTLGSEDGIYGVFDLFYEHHVAKTSMFYTYVFSGEYIY